MKPRLSAPRNGRATFFHTRISLPICAALAAAGLSAGGCGDSGPPRYALSGSVTYEGQPVPSGWIVFAPENGPGAGANITDGRYETPQGWGTVGGPHTIEMVAMNVKEVPDPYNEDATIVTGQVTFQYTFKSDLPMETTTFDIELTREDLRRGR